MFPEKVLVIDYSLPSGIYCEIREAKPMDDGRPNVYFVTDNEIEVIESRMKEIIAADLPFGKAMMSVEECVKIFERQNQIEKVDLMKTLGRFNYNVYMLDGCVDTFYGPLIPSTGMLSIFDLMGFNEGFCLQYPMDGCPDKVLPMKRQSKIATALEEHSDWCSVMGVHGVGTLNAKVKSGEIVDLINLSEALHERKYAEIADQIYARRGSVKIVFIAGPSSSGKTSTSKRLALQCRILGMNPKVIELDNYFVDREFTPRDEKGEYDFECLGAMDLKLLGQQLHIDAGALFVVDVGFVQRHYHRNSQLQQLNTQLQTAQSQANPAQLAALQAKLDEANQRIAELEATLAKNTPSVDMTSEELEAYRKALLKYRYEQLYVNERLDTAVSDDKIDAYYEAHKESFVLSRPLVKARFLRIHTDSPMLENIRKKMDSSDVEDIVEADSLAFSSAMMFTTWDDQWQDITVLARELGVPYDSVLDMMNKGWIRQDDTTGVTNMAFVTEVLKVGEYAPVDYSAPRIKDIIISTRKQALISGLEQDLLKDARENGQFVIY